MKNENESAVYSALDMHNEAAAYAKEVFEKSKRAGKNSVLVENKDSVNTVQKAFDESFDPFADDEAGTGQGSVNSFADDEAAAEKTKSKSAPVLPDWVYEKLDGGLMGELFKQMQEMDSDFQKPRGLAVALFVMSLLMNQNFQIWGTKGEISPNVYFLILAGTGSGKTNVLKFPKKCLRYGRMFETKGNPKRKKGDILGKYSSAQAILFSLQPRSVRPEETTYTFHDKNFSPRGWVLDEMGEVLGKVKNSSNDYTRAIYQALLDLFSASSDVFDETATKEDLKIREPIKIKKPFFSVLGASTWEAIEGAISTEDVTKGLIPRILVIPEELGPKKSFQEFEAEAFRQLNNMEKHEIPKSTISKIWKWLDYWDESKPPCPVLIQSTEEAQKIMAKFSAKLSLESAERENPFRIDVFKRCCEYAYKLALLFRGSRLDFTTLQDLIDLKYPKIEALASDSDSESDECPIISNTASGEAPASDDDSGTEQEIYKEKIETYLRENHIVIDGECMQWGITVAECLTEYAY